jgi:glycosyltransferase involved in cell wall biosynthesis
MRALSEHIHACDVMLQPFPDGISARHTSALASLALGRPIVTNSGPLTEALWREEDAVVLAGPESRAMADAVLALLADGPTRERLADAARSLYERVFDVRHAVSMLRQEANVLRPVSVRSHAEA